MKFRRRAEDGSREPAQVYGSIQVEVAWTVIPVLIVVVMFIVTARVIASVHLVANGDARIMIPTYRSYVMSQALPNAKLVIYPDSGHVSYFSTQTSSGRGCRIPARLANCADRFVAGAHKQWQEFPKSRQQNARWD